MNLHGIVAPYVGAVNPLVRVVVSSSNGYTVGADFKQVPAYDDPVAVLAQVQPLSYKDLMQLEGINQNGVKWKLYVSGQIDGVVRPEMKGGDLIVIDSGPHQGTWLCAQVLEQFPDWTCCAIVLQNGG
jgi:hypothetical protein